jgi:predicted Rossmann-fold nucleotide-binding protein
MEAVSGGIGTLVEVALARNLFYMRLIEPRPLVLVGSSWARAIEDLRGVLEASDAHMEHIETCPDVESAVEHLKLRGVFL